ncbi:hypothetical protein JCM21900_001552 [Sporobolomyces salmonicolor]
MATLTEDQIVTGFHGILQDSLAQARGEGLLSDDELETADVDVQVAGPALALFFAALGARGDPPSISSPDGSFVLSASNCPPSFENAFRLWQACVRPIKKLPSEARHDLSRLLCDKPAASSPLRIDVARLSCDLKGIALEILQRRSFQLRFQHDLNAALKSAVRPRMSSEFTSASSHGHSYYEPPPLYSEGRPTEETKRAYGIEAGAEGSPAANVQAALPSQYDENLSVIRETLYSAFADAIVETPEILQQLSRGAEWASRAFFASTCLAILEVALTRMDEGGVRTVNLGRGSPRVIGIRETPPYLRPFLSKLVELSQAIQSLAEEDDERAMREAADGATEFTPPKMERLKERLAKGVGAEETVAGSAASRDQQVAGLANAVNEMALGMASLPAFRERQAEAFKVLASVTAL